MLYNSWNPSQPYWLTFKLFPYFNYVNFAVGSHSQEYGLLGTHLSTLGTKAGGSPEPNSSRPAWTLCIKHNIFTGLIGNKKNPKREKKKTNANKQKPWAETRTVYDGNLLVKAALKKMPRALQSICETQPRWGPEPETLASRWGL